MKLDFEVLDLRTAHEFHIARETAPPAWKTVWVRIRDDDGVEGWGEAAPNAYYGETVDTVQAVLPHLARALDGLEDDPLALEHAERALDDLLAGNRAAKCGISAALHDLAGKRLGVPVWKMLGLDPGRAPMSSFTIGIDDPEVMRVKVREAAPYPVLKIKVGTARDEEVLRLIREEAPDKTLRVDANTAWTAKEAIRAVPMLEEYGVEFVEQPLRADDVEGLRLLRSNSRLPIISDESSETAADVARLAGVVDGINIKLAKAGGIREAVRMAHVARAHGLEVMLGCMIETTVGIAAAVQIAPLVDYVDLDGAALLANDPFAGPGIERDGKIRFNEEAGLGVRRR